MDRPPPDAYRLLGKLDLHRNDDQGDVGDLSHYLSDARKNDAIGLVSALTRVSWAGRERADESGIGPV